MKPNIEYYQTKVLKVLAGQIDDFYLGGGTALSLYYFHHRESMDLDFFTKRFSKILVSEAVKLLSSKLNKKIRLIREESRKNRIKLLVYSLNINKKQTLKIDFIEDYLDSIKPPKLINGIKVLSLEDIYMRKIYAISGTFQREDIIGRNILQGGRQDAKDFYDLYCLSHIYMRLSDFAFRYCNQLIREGMVRWFRTYSRLQIKSGLLELKLRKNIDYTDMERHFKKEINRILEKEVDFI